MAPLNATTASSAIQTAKNEGRCSAKATRPKSTPLRTCVRMTKNFLVLYSSRIGLQRNLIVHGHMISEVQKAIWASLTCLSLNITVETMFRTTKGKPIAKYRVGTHFKGDAFLLIGIRF